MVIINEKKYISPLEKGLSRILLRIVYLYNKLSNKNLFCACILCCKTQNKCQL